MKKNYILLFLILISTSAFAATAPQSFTYQGKLMNAAGTAPLSSIVNLKLDIYDPSAACLLYSETQTGIDLSQTNGLFAVQVGSGLADTPNKRTASVDQGLAMAQVFANNGQILAPSTPGCLSGYTPAAGDGRILRVSVTNGGATTVITPDLKIGSVPNAIVAETLQGLPPANFIQALSGVTQSSVSNAVNLPSLKASPGYVKLPGGIIMQWGYYDAYCQSNSYQMFSFSLPTAFPTAGVYVMGTIRDPERGVNNAAPLSAVNGLAVTTTSVTGAVSSGAITNGNCGLNWFAVGY